MNDEINKILDPNLIKKHLLLASLFLTGYELLKSAILDDLKAFFTDGFDENGRKIDPDYEKKVLCKNENPFMAHCLWLVDEEVISLEDVEEINKIRSHRNMIAHSLTNLMFAGKMNIDVGLLRKMKYYIDIIGRFWARIDIDTNPDFDRNQIHDEDITSGRQVLFDYLISIVDADTDKIEPSMN